MKKPKQYYPLKNKSYAGFSLIEALVSLAIISLIGLIIFAAFSIEVKSITQSHSSLLVALRRLKVDTVLQKSLEKVRIPYWETDYEISASATKIAVPWYEGEKEPVSIALPSGVTDVKCELVKSENRAPVGCRVNYRIDGHDYSTSVVFASVPPGILKP